MIRRLAQIPLVVVFGLVAISCGGAQVKDDSDKTVASSEAGDETGFDHRTAAPVADDGSDGVENVSAETAQTPADTGFSGNASLEDALSALRGGDLEGGKTALSAVVGSGSSDPVVLFNLALAERISGDLELAETHALQAVSASKGADKVVDLYVTVVIDRGRAEPLVASLEDLVERYPDSKALKVSVVRALIEAKQAPRALQLAKDLLKKDEANVEIMKWIARSYMAMERTEAARFVLVQALEVSKSAEIYTLLGGMSWAQGDTAKAISMFEEAVRIEPGEAAAHNALGVLYHAAGDTAGAIAELEAAIAVDPTFAAAHMNLGNAHRKGRDFDKAFTAYQTALRLSANCAGCVFNMGVAELENIPADSIDQPDHYRRAVEHLLKYKDMMLGTRTDDSADKYIDEARRMAEFLENEAKLREQMAKEKAENPPPEGDAVGEDSVDDAGDDNDLSFDDGEDGGTAEDSDDDEGFDFGDEEGGDAQSADADPAVDEAEKPAPQPVEGADSSESTGTADEGVSENADGAGAGEGDMGGEDEEIDAL